jgi:hypothetical protein
MDQWARRTYGDYGYTEHLGGVPWDEAPVPRWLHRCRPQSRWWDTQRREMEERCACGGVRLDGRRPWIRRNTSSPLTAAERAEKDHDRAFQALADEFNEAELRRDGQRMNEIIAELRWLRARGQVFGQPHPDSSGQSSSEDER